MSSALAMHDPAGESRRLAEALEAEIPRLRAYVARLLGQRQASADAEDVLQEVLARAWRSRASYDARRALGPWLRTTALRAVLDHRDQRRARPVDRDERSEDHALAHDTSPLAEREHLERLLAPLSEVEREVLLRFHQREESVAEIARALRMPEGTAKSHLSRARRKLAERGEER